MRRKRLDEKNVHNISLLFLIAKINKLTRLSSLSLKIKKKKYDITGTRGSSANCKAENKIKRNKTDNEGFDPPSYAPKRALPIELVAHY